MVIREKLFTLILRYGRLQLLLVDDGMYATQQFNGTNEYGSSYDECVVKIII